MFFHPKQTKNVDVSEERHDHCLLMIRITLFITFSLVMSPQSKFSTFYQLTMRLIVNLPTHKTDKNLPSSNVITNLSKVSVKPIKKWDKNQIHGCILFSNRALVRNNINICNMQLNCRIILLHTL